jgi:UDP-2-acetamido-3-amino-2,3-dideoxy-glucuronate N-acetyltransferase
MTSANVCVVGCGHWGKNLIRAFAGLQRLRGVCDIDPGRARQLADTYPGTFAYDGYDSVLRDPAVKAVVLATPAEQHHEMALAAITAGKDVFVEKPLALEAEDGHELVDAAREKNRILMVGHLLHYHPALVKLKQLVQSGALGRIEYIYSNRLSMGKIRREENALWSFAPHDISVIISLVGQTPFQVTATGGAYLQPNIADVTISNLLFDHGTRAHIFVSWLHPYKEQRLVVIGSKQMAVFEDSRADRKLMLFNKQIELKNGSFEAMKPEGTPVDFEPTEPLRLECQHFLECIDDRKRPLTPGEEGVRVLQVLQACQRSLQLNGEPVQVSNGVRHKVMAM